MQDGACTCRVLPSHKLESLGPERRRRSGPRPHSCLDFMDVDSAYRGSDGSCVYDGGYESRCGGAESHGCGESAFALIRCSRQAQAIVTDRCALRTCSSVRSTRGPLSSSLSVVRWLWRHPLARPASLSGPETSSLRGSLLPGESPSPRQTCSFSSSVPSSRRIRSSSSWILSLLCPALAAPLRLYKVEHVSSTIHDVYRPRYQSVETETAVSLPLA